MNNGEQQLDEGKVKELVGTILSHPSFRETLKNLFTPTALKSGESVNTTTPPLLIQRQWSAVLSIEAIFPMKPASSPWRSGYGVRSDAQ